MNRELIKISKKICKSVLSIGVDEEISSALEYNKNILELDILELYKKKKGRIKTKYETERKKKLKRINIKKLRKIYNKKKVDYIICNYEVVKKYMRYFVKDSIYINNNTLYLYGISNSDIKNIISKYKRYNVLLRTTDKKNYFIIEIDNKNSKNYIIKDKLYFIYDTFTLISDVIGDILIN